MATRRDEMPPSTRGGSKPKYHWNEWSDGSTWEVKHGEDFHTEPKIFAQQVRNRATKMGFKVTISVRGDSVFFQFFTPEEDE